MPNLLPEIERKRQNDERRDRVVAAGLFFLIAGEIIAIIFLLPSYFSEEINRQVILSQIKVIEESITAKGGANTDQELQAAQTKILALSSATSTLSVHEVILRLVSSKPNGVTITSLTYIPNGKAGSLKVEGGASTREKLLQFKSNLENDSLFQNVDLPLSELVKSANIHYGITLTGSFTP